MAGVFRNDHEAALQRISSLEQELARVRRERDRRSNDEPVLTSRPRIVPPPTEPSNDATQLRFGLPDRPDLFEVGWILMAVLITSIMILCVA